MSEHALPQPVVATYPRDAVPALLAQLNDTGNARWFVACVGGRLRWVSQRNRWFGWDGQRWSENIVIETFVDTALHLMRAAADEYDGANAYTFRDWVRRAGDLRRRRAMLACAKGLLSESINTR